MRWSPGRLRQPRTVRAIQGRGPVSRSGPEEPRTAGRMRPPDQSGLQWEITGCLESMCHLQFDVEKLYRVAVAGLLDTIEAVPQADGHPRRARHLGQRRLMCRSRSKVSTGELNWTASATAVKSRNGLHRQRVSSASGKFYAMMQQVERPSEGADLHHLAASALPRHGAAPGRKLQVDGRLGSVPRYLTSPRRPRTLPG